MITFLARGGGNLRKKFPKIQMPGGLPGGLPGGDVEASIWLVHKGLSKREMFGDQTSSNIVLVTKHADVEVSGQTVKTCLIKHRSNNGYTSRRASVVPTSFPGYSLYFEKVLWLRLVTCLSMPTQAVPRVGPQLKFVNTAL